MNHAFVRGSRAQRNPRARKPGTQSDRSLERWLLATGVAYGTGAAVFVARPGEATAALSRAGGEALDDEPAGLYHSLAVAYMTTISSLALGAATKPAWRAALLPPLLVAKAASSAALLHRFLVTRRPGYAAGAALDAAILGVTAGLLANAARGNR